MNEQERQELNGRLYAQELLINVLFKSYVTHQIPGKGQETEHLDSLVSDLQRSFEAQATKMSAVSAASAKTTIFRLLDASCQKYWT